MKFVFADFLCYNKTNGSCWGERMFKYETHLHTAPVSACAHASVRENLEFYKAQGYDGVFITNHFLDGNINVDWNLPYEEKVNFYFSDYEEGLKLSEEIGIKVFLGVELSYKGTDFLIYGLDKAWYLDHPEIMDMKKTDELAYMMKAGALVIQAHPYRERDYINHIRLFPRSVHGAEILNGSDSELENTMSHNYAEKYQLLEFAGSDNHVGAKKEILVGMSSERPIHSEQDFIKAVLNKEMNIFTMNV